MSTMSSGSEDHPRKRMRKGTRSCQECRRRKIRCVFQPDAHICNGCAPRGTECIEQNLVDTRVTPLEKRKNVRDRLGQLEDMVGQILHKLDTKEGPNRESSERDAAEALRSLQSELVPLSTGLSGGSPTTRSTRAEVGRSSDLLDSALHPSNYFKNSPLLSLFDNTILSHNRAQGPDRRSAGAENQDFQLRTRRRRVPATATAHISATTHFFAKINIKSIFSTTTPVLQPFNTCINTLNTDASN